jgi:hypothetical protein
MKRISFLVLAAMICVVFPLVAQDAQSSEGNLTYVNARVYKVYDHKDAYIVVYEKHSNKAAKVIIPKQWIVERPRKLEIRNMVAPLNQAYMSVWYKDGAFDHVVLTLPRSRQHPVWGAAPWANVEGDLDKSSIALEF